MPRRNGAGDHRRHPPIEPPVAENSGQNGTCPKQQTNLPRTRAGLACPHVCAQNRAGVDRRAAAATWAPGWWRRAQFVLARGSPQVSKSPSLQVFKSLSLLAPSAPSRYCGPQLEPSACVRGPLAGASGRPGKIVSPISFRSHGNKHRCLALPTTWPLAATLPRDGTAGALRRPRLAARGRGPRRGRGARRWPLRHFATGADHARFIRGRRTRAHSARRKGERIWRANGDPRQHARGTRATGAGPGCWPPSTLAAIKAAGVTFPRSMLERVIEEQARGAPREARRRSAKAWRPSFGGNLANLVPGSKEAAELKRVLIARGRLVAIPRGRDRTGRGDLHQGAADGRRSATAWMRACTRSRPGTIRSRRSCCVDHVAEAPSSAPRSATTSICATSRAARRCCSPRPRTTMPPRRYRPVRALLRRRRSPSTTVRRIEVSLKVEGEDGFVLNGRSLDARDRPRPGGPRRADAGAASPISGRRRAVPRHHVRARSKDRGAKGQGFTHKMGDVTTIAAPELGHARQPHDAVDRGAARGPFGTGALMRNLARARPVVGLG